MADVFRVKPLEWRHEGIRWSADTIFGLYFIYKDAGPYFTAYGPLATDYYGAQSLEASKVRAEQWYRDRLAPALEVVELKSEA